HEACEFCQRRENREQVIEALAAPRNLNISKEAIQRSLLGPFQFHKDRVEPIPDLQLFSGPGVNEPGMDKAVWTREGLVATGVLSQSLSPDRAQLATMFRGDIFVDATGIDPLGAGHAPVKEAEPHGRIPGSTQNSLPQFAAAKTAD